MTLENFEESGVRIELSIDYDFLTTTDIEQFLEDIRKPIMKNLQEENLAKKRDQIHIEKIQKESPLFIEFTLIVLETTIGTAIGTAIGTPIGIAIYNYLKDKGSFKKSKENIRRTIRRRKNIINGEMTLKVEEEILEEFDLRKGI